MPAEGTRLGNVSSGFETAAAGGPPSSPYLRAPESELLPPPEDTRAGQGRHSSLNIPQGPRPHERIRSPSTSVATDLTLSLQGGCGPRSPSYSWGSRARRCQLRIAPHSPFFPPRRHFFHLAGDTPASTEGQTLACLCLHSTAGSVPTPEAVPAPSSRTHPARPGHVPG